MSEILEDPIEACKIFLTGSIVFFSGLHELEKLNPDAHFAGKGPDPHAILSNVDLDDRALAGLRTEPVPRRVPDLEGLISARWPLGIHVDRHLVHGTKLGMAEISNRQGKAASTIAIRRIELDDCEPADAVASNGFNRSNVHAPFESPISNAKGIVSGEENVIHVGHVLFLSFLVS